MTHGLKTAEAAGMLAASVAGAAPLRIVTTTAELADIAGAIAGDAARITAVCGPNDDPHFLQAKPGTIVEARRADVWIRVGMELEIGWEPSVLNQARNPRILPGASAHLDVSERVLKRDVPEGRVTRDMGHVPPSGNPHVWHDPWNGRVIAEQIAERLSRLAPDQSAAFQANLDAFRKRLDEAMFGESLVAQLGGDALWRDQIEGRLDERLKAAGSADRLGGWAAVMRPHRGKRIVTFHKSLVYAAHRFGVEVAAELEPKPGIPPTASHLAWIEDLMRRNNIRLIVQETFYSRRAADRVAKAVGADVRVIAGHVGGTPEAGDYIGLINAIVTALSGA